jgi:hypothetical protein
MYDHSPQKTIQATEFKEYTYKEKNK